METNSNRRLETRPTTYLSGSSLPPADEHGAQVARSPPPSAVEDIDQYLEASDITIKLRSNERRRLQRRLRLK